jgi:GTP-binding protein
VVNATFDLFIDLGATDEQADFPVIYTRALDGQAGFEPDELAPDLKPLFETIIDYLPGPQVDPDGPTQMLVTTLEYSDYVGRIAVGRLTSGALRAGRTIMHISATGEMKPMKVTKLYTFQNLQRVEQEVVQAGDIVAVAGIPKVSIGDTLADRDDPRPLPPITVEEPTVRMAFNVNNSPFAGREGKYVTSRQLRERLMRELESNVALRVADTRRPASLSSPVEANCTWPSSSRPCAGRATNFPSAGPRLFSTKVKPAGKSPLKTSSWKCIPTTWEPYPRCWAGAAGN